MKRPAKIEPRKRERVRRKQRTTSKRERPSLKATVRKQPKKRTGPIGARRRPTTKSQRKSAATTRTKRSSRKENLRTKIFAALGNAGQAGIGLEALAAELGAQAGALSAWFQAAMKRHPTIKKFDRTRYRLEVEIPTVEVQASVGAARVTSVEQPNLPWRARIQEALRAAGPNGLSLQELAAQLGVNYKHLAAWFATTGRKLPSIQKVGATTYRFAVP